ICAHERRLGRPPCYSRRNHFNPWQVPAHERSLKETNMTAPRHRTVRDLAEKIWLRVAVPPEIAPNATLLLRLMAGSVFLWEGILKFVFVNQGVGRFT